MIDNNAETAQTAEAAQIVIYAEYCHDYAQRFTPLVALIRGHYGSCRVVGMFPLYGRSVAEVMAGPFDELYCFPTPDAAVERIKGQSLRQFFAFVDHNPTFQDLLLYASLKGIYPNPAVLFRNTVSLARFLTLGKDDDLTIRRKLSCLRSGLRTERLKTRILVILAGMVIKAGRLIRAAAGPEANWRKRILFLRLDLLGDMTVTLPYLAAVKKQYPDAELTVMASSKGAAILSEQAAITPGLLYDNLEIWDAPWHRKNPRAIGIPELKEMLSRLPRAWKHNYDIIVQPVNFGTGILFALLCLGKRVVAPIDSRLPLSLGIRKYVSDPVEPPRERIPHMVDFLALTLARFGISEEAVRPVFNVKPEARERMGALLARKGHAATKKLILVNVGAGNRLRCWGIGNFCQLILALLEHQTGTIALIGARNDVATADEIAHIVGHSVVNTAGRLDLGDLAALISLANLTITADTAVMHITAALDKPVLALFGAGLVDYCRPLNAENFIAKSELGCSGCGDQCFATGYPPPCLAAVTPGYVFDAAVAMLMKN